MSLMSLLDEQTVLVDLPWLAVETVELLQSRGYRLIEIEYSERDTLACNVLSLGEKRLLALEENRDDQSETSPGGIRCTDLSRLRVMRQRRRRPHLPDPPPIASHVV